MDPKKIIKNGEFFQTYIEIVRDLGYSQEEDLKARNLLHEFLLQIPHYSLEDLLESIQHLLDFKQYVFIIGGGPDAVQFVEWLNKIIISLNFDKKSLLIIAIDGATELLAQYHIIPRIIFSDLDGIQESTIKMPEYQDTFFVIHAHGDNQSKLYAFKSILQSRLVIGTTQVASKLPVINTGGFTDGDRALYFLENFVKSRHNLFLIGFDFSPIIGKFSKPLLKENSPASPLKRKKLHYGAKLTRDVCARMSSHIHFLEHNYTYILKNELINCRNCSFIRFISEKDFREWFLVNLLYQQQ